MPAGTLLLATWGNPSAWALAEYTVEGRGSEPLGSAESFTSTSALASVLGPDKVVILGLDTLFGKEEVEGYDDIVSRSRMYLEKYLCNLEAEIRVLPGIITAVSGKLRVSGDPRDYYRLALYNIASIILEELPDDIVLDITHGINFMPALTVRAALEAAAYASLANSLRKGGTVRVSIYNSDPIQVPWNDPCKRDRDNPCQTSGTNGKCHPTKLTIHMIESQRAGIPELISAIDRLAGEWRGSTPQIVKPTSGKGEIPSISRRLNREHEGTVRKAITLLKLFRHGLVPELLSYIVEERSLGDMLRKALDDALDLWRSAVSVRRENGFTVVERGARLWSGFEVLTHALALHGALQAGLQAGGAIDSSLETAKRLRDSYEKLGARITYTIQNRELEKIRRALEKLPEPEREHTVSLACLYEAAGYGSYRDISNCSTFVRDLVAHGGWHTSVVLLERGKDRVRVRVAPEGVCLENGRLVGLWEVLDRRL